MQKNEKLDQYLTPHINVNSKQSQRFERKPEIAKLLGKNAGSGLLDIRCGRDVLDLTPEAQGTRGDVTQGNHRKPKCSARQEASDEIKTQPPGLLDGVRKVAV